jgi:hypothetical protein
MYVRVFVCKYMRLYIIKKKKKKVKESQFPFSYYIFYAAIVDNGRLNSVI